MQMMVLIISGKLYLTNSLVVSLHKASANSSHANKKLWKTQVYKMKRWFSINKKSDQSISQKCSQTNRVNSRNISSRCRNSKRKFAVWEQQHW